MANRSFFLRACKVVDENKKSYEEKAAETRQHSARLVDMQRYVDMSTEKRGLLLDLILNGRCPDDPNESVLHRGAIVFAKYLDVIAQLEKDFDAAGISYYTITGKTSQEKRGEIAKIFRADPYNKVILLSSCGSESISLHSTNLLFMYNSLGSAGASNQLWGRVSRFGSHFSQFFINYIVVEDSIDQYFPILLSSKKELEEEILNADYIDLKKETGSFNAYILKNIRKQILWKSSHKKGYDKK